MSSTSKKGTELTEMKQTGKENPICRISWKTIPDFWKKHPSAEKFDLSGYVSSYPDSRPTVAWHF